MGLGILNTKEHQHVFGTTLLEEKEPEGVETSRLKVDPRNPQVILVPQPSDDPNDPLNWSLLKKNLCFIALCCGSSISTCAGPMLSSAYLDLEVEFSMSLTKVVQFGSIVMIMGAPALWIAGSLIPIVGKRPLILMSILLEAVTSVWGAKANSYGSMLGARAVMGISNGPPEAVVAGVIGDLFFLHERGFYSSMWNMSQLIATNISPLIPAFIVVRLGWRWAFWILAICSIVVFGLIFFLAPETHYVRSLQGDDISLPEDVADNMNQEEKGNVLHAEIPPAATSRNPSPSHEKSYIGQLRIFNGVTLGISFWDSLTRPFVVLLFPTVLFASFGYTMSICYSVLLSNSVAQVMGEDPYNFSTIELGVLYVSPIVWTFIAFLIAGRLSDYFSKNMALLNRGVFEPEFRLVLIIALLVLGVMSLIGYGLSVIKHVHWFGPVFFFGMNSAAACFGNTAYISYVIDAHRTLAAESLIAFGIFKSVLIYILLYFITDWINNQGVKKTFITLACLNVFCCLTAVPMYINGKRTRRFIQSIRVLNRLQVQEMEQEREREAMEMRNED
ncbi:MFS general substrate transporter [Limtongia smithiae]|uniref:MFS general substrate transporter n=1 Tax=Limtongia smithiae TaxID=1125753 RepID=UPI0034CDFE73